MCPLSLFELRALRPGGKKAFSIKTRSKGLNTLMYYPAPSDSYRKDSSASLLSSSGMLPLKLQPARILKDGYMEDDSMREGTEKRTIRNVGDIQLMLLQYVQVLQVS